MSIPAPSPSLSGLPPYLFVRLNAVIAKAHAAGRSLIDLGMGNPDRPTPARIVSALSRSVKKEAWTHRYPQTRGLASLRKAVARYYRRRFGVLLDPDTEVLPLLGSKEGLAHLCAAYLSPGDAALVPNPCYPVHYNGPMLCGGRSVLMPIEKRNDFFPEFGKLSPSELARARFMILNYPNNPTGAVVEGLDQLQDAARFAKKRGLFIAYDNAYAELCFDGYRAPSILQLPGAKGFAIEFNSLSKSYSMAGWRIGYAVGNAQILAALGKFKSFLDYGVPGFIQQAAAEALDGPESELEALRRLYSRRRDVLVDALAAEGWRVPRPRATMYLWGRLPNGRSSLAFAQDLIRKEGVVVAPGVGFGPCGEGSVRFALVDEEPRLKEAARRIGRFLKGS